MNDSKLLQDVSPTSGSKGSHKTHVPYKLILLTSNWSIVELYIASFCNSNSIYILFESLCGSMIYDKTVLIFYIKFDIVMEIVVEHSSMYFLIY